MSLRVKFTADGGGWLTDGVSQSRLPKQLCTALMMLMCQPIVTPDDFIDVVYGHRADGGPLTAPKVLSAHIMYLRRLIEPYGWRIVNIWGMGYRLDRAS